MTVEERLAPVAVLDAGDRASWRSGGDGFDIDVQPVGEVGGVLAFSGGGAEALGYAVADVPIAEARGKRLRLTGRIRAELSDDAWASLLLRADGDSEILELASLEAAPVEKDSDWREYGVEIAVPAHAERVIFGGFVRGAGKAWFDSLRVEQVEQPTRVTVSGRVTDAAGAPVAGAEVTAFVRYDAFASATARTAADGSYRLALVPGEYRVSLGHASLAAPAQRIAAPEAVDFQMTAGAVRVGGSVRDAEGQLVANVPVSFYGLASGDVHLVSTGADGRYAIALPTAGSYSVSVGDAALYSEPRTELLSADQSLGLVAYRPEPASPEAIAQLRTEAHPLASTSVTSDHADLSPFRALVGDARVVALGEATHGTREFFQLKHRLLAYLVEELGFDVFAIEASYPESLAVDRYVRTGEGDPREALSGMHFWVWDTEEVLALIEWMRAYNARPDRARTLRFLGVDMQFVGPGSELLRAYLAEIDAAWAAEHATGLAALAEKGYLSSLAKASAAEQSHARELLARIGARMDARRVRQQRRGGRERWVEMRQVVTVLEQAVEMMTAENVYGVRDRAMADNTAWILDAVPKSKVVLWAHNAHIERRSSWTIPSQGQHLVAALGEGYRAIGFAFHRGGFQARDGHAGGHWGVCEHRVQATPPDTLGSVLAQTGHPLALVDLRGIDASSPLGQWLDAPRRAADTGAVFVGALQLLRPYRVRDVFDALLFVEHTTRARPNPNGVRRPAAIGARIEPPR